MSERCPICGEPLEEGKIAYKGGWRYCIHHRVAIKPAKYSGRCHVCMGVVLVDEDVLLTKLEEDTPWVVIHRRDRCEGDVHLLSGAPNSSYAVLYVTPDAPKEVIKAAYRALAQKYHPDRGGDVMKMQEINTAMAELVR